MELFARRIAALPGGNGVLLGMDFIYQVAVSGRQATRGCLGRPSVDSAGVSIDYR